jgi:uncharacterized protein
MPNSSSMKEFVVDLLKNNIPAFYYYHNYKHTLYVVEKAIEIGKGEGCSERDIDLVTAGALWHDTGFLHSYADHEDQSLLLARQYLPEYGYAKDEIDKICGMIMATKIPQSPKNKLEEIVADADLEYLGTSDAPLKAEHLFQEWRHKDPSLTREKWNKIQISFIQNHHYFTDFCREKKEKPKLAYLQTVIEQEKQS